MENVTKSYLICATPRSGSSLLCEALRNTRLAGKPDEYFGPMHVERWKNKWGTISNQEYLERVISYSRGETTVIGIKVMRLYWRNFIRFLNKARGLGNLSDYETLNQCFPNLQFIFITRRDKVRQGISWMKFLQGSAWHWIEDEPQQIDNLEFRPEVIKDFLIQVSVHEAAWMEFFGHNEIQPFTVVYEDFVNSYEDTAKELLKYLGIPHQENLKFGERQFRRQADDLTDEWVQKFLNRYKDTEIMPE